MVTVPSRRRVTYPHPPFVSQGPTGEKDEDPGTGTKEAGEQPRHKPGRRQRKSACQGGGRANGETTKETGGSQQPSKGRKQGRGHSKHTATTTQQQSTREGGTRGADKERHHAPRHAPHRHHTRRTRPHLSPQRVASGPQQPAQRAGSWKGGRLNPDAPHQPRGAQPPAGHPSHGASLGPPHPDTRAHSTWVADPDSPPGGRAVGGGGAPDPRRPPQRRKAPPTGTPFRHPDSTQRRPAREHAVGLVLSPHARTNCTRDTRVAEPRLPAEGDGRSGEGQRLTPDAPHNGGRLPPPGTAPHRPPRHAAPTGHATQGDTAGPPLPHTRANSTLVADADVGGGRAPDLRRRSERRKAPPPVDALPPPPQRATPAARAHAVGPMLGPHANTNPPWDTRVAEPRLPAPEDGRPGEGQRLTPEAPHNGGRPTPLGTAPHHPGSTQPPQGIHARGTVLGPHTRTPAPTARG